MPYQQLQRYLRTPPPITIDPLLSECDPPEDPDWPAPSTREEVEQLMRQLPHWAQVVCALTAAEMVLPIWETHNWINENLSEEQIEAPHQAIEVIRQWLDDEALQVVTVENIREPVYENVWAVATAAEDAATRIGPTSPTGNRPLSAAWAAWAAVSALDARIRSATWGATEAAQYAGMAAAIAAHGSLRNSDSRISSSIMDFYREWWDLCRCRLAFILEARI